MHDSVLAAYAGVAPPERMTRSLATLSGKPSPDVIQIGTPSFYHFYLQALRRAGKHQEALEAPRQAYGKMLKAGATTWWEHLGGYASLSHAWSCGPSYDLPASVLGVQPTAPAYAAFRVEPQPADLQWARGLIPTVQGDVSVEWSRDPAKFDLRVNVPMKARVELSVPAVSLDATKLTGKRGAVRRDFREGRARYWVTGPGFFDVESSLIGVNRQPGAEIPSALRRLAGKPSNVRPTGGFRGKEQKMAEPSFPDYFAAANAHPGLTERERMFIGLAVTLSRGCEP